MTALVPVLASGQNLTLRDDAGTVFVLADAPRRIVSLAPNITEILFALGVGDRVIGVTRYCDYPPAALQKEKVGGLLDPDIEKIRALGPDLVIAFRGNPWNSIKRIQSLGLKVFVLDIGRTLETVPRTIEKIGGITRRDTEARDLVRTLEEKSRALAGTLAAVRQEPRVFLNIQGLGLSTCGRESYLNDLIERVRGINVAAGIRRDWLEYSREQLLKDDPDMIIILARSEGDFKRARAWFKSQAGFQGLRAVREGRIRFLEENIASRFGPRLYEALEELARILHPELFNPALPKISDLVLSSQTITPTSGVTRNSGGRPIGNSGAV